MVFKIKISLELESPAKVERTLLVPIDYNFHQLHQIFQAALGWRNAHLFEFGEEDSIINIGPEIHEEAVLTARGITIQSIFFKLFQRYQMSKSGFGAGPVDFFYIYDLGDFWKHKIEIVEFIREDIPCQILEGVGACPPEDCGGQGGYEELLKVMSTKKPAKRYSEMLSWLAQAGYSDFDSKHFDVDEANAELNKVVKTFAQAKLN